MYICVDICQNIYIDVDKKTYIYIHLCIHRLLLVKQNSFFAFLLLDFVHELRSFFR